MAVLALVGAVVGIDVVAKLRGTPTITQVLRNNRDEAFIGLVWLTVHLFKKERQAS